MALVERLENCKAASSFKLRATSRGKIPGWLEAHGSKLAASEGAEIAEVAVVLPLVFMFLLGIVWFGRAFNIYATITQAAQQGAITAARASCATCGSQFPDKDAVADSVIAVLNASNLNSRDIIFYKPPTIQSCTSSLSVACQRSSNVSVCSSVLLNPTSGNAQPAQCGMLVSFQYPFQFYLPFTSLNQQRIVLTAQGQTRMEQ